LDFSDSDNEQAVNYPCSVEEAKAELENTEAEEADKEEQVGNCKAATKAPDGLLDFLDSEDKEPEKKKSAEVLDAGQGKAADTEKISPDSDLTGERSRQIDEFYKHEGVFNFSDDKGDPKKKEPVKPVKQIPD